MSNPLPTLSELDAMEKAATRGPWYPRATDDDCRMNARFVSTECGPLTEDGRWMHDGQSRSDGFPNSVCVTLHQLTPTIGVNEDDENTELIAASRNALPALLSDLRLCREALERISMNTNDNGSGAADFARAALAKLQVKP